MDKAKILRECLVALGQFQYSANPLLPIVTEKLFKLEMEELKLQYQSTSDTSVLFQVLLGITVSVLLWVGISRLHKIHQDKVRGGGQMTTRYEIIKAEAHQEALEKSKFQKGALARIEEVEAVANSNGTWTVVPIVEALSKEETRVIDMALKEYRENRTGTKVSR